MLVLLQFRWPVLRCPSLAAFQPSPEGVLAVHFGAIVQRSQPGLDIVELRSIHYVLWFRVQILLNLLLRYGNWVIRHRMRRENFGDGAGLSFFERLDFLEEVHEAM